MLLNSYLITKCTIAAHKHIFTSFPNTVIPFQTDTQLSQITKPLGIFPDWSLLSLRGFAFSGKRVRSWCYLIILILSRLPLTSTGIQRIRHCWFWASFKAVTTRHNHSLVLQAVHQCKTREKHISVLWHFQLSVVGFFLSTFCRSAQNFQHLWADTQLSIRQDLHCTPLATPAHKLCRSNMKSSFRSQQPHISKATMSTVLLQALLNLLAPKSLCPKRLYLVPSPFLP